jgi:hypothetical protein
MFCQPELLSSFATGQLEKALGRARSFELRPGVTVVTDAERHRLPEYNTGADLGDKNILAREFRVKPRRLIDLGKFTRSVWRFEAAN